MRVHNLLTKCGVIFSIFSDRRNSADGGNSFGNFDQVLNRLSNRGLLFRHETVGLGIGTGSDAVQQLTNIPASSGGGYHLASNPKQLNAHLKTLWKIWPWPDCSVSLALRRKLHQLTNLRPCGIN